MMKPVLLYGSTKRIYLQKPLHLQNRAARIILTAERTSFSKSLFHCKLGPFFRLVESKSLHFNLSEILILTTSRGRGLLANKRSRPDDVPGIRWVRVGKLVPYATTIKLPIWEFGVLGRKWVTQPQ